MTIPRKRSDVIALITIRTVFVVFSILAVVNLANGDAVIPSLLLLGIVALFLWVGICYEGGFVSFLTLLLGEVTGRRFAEVTTDGGKPHCLRFGNELFGHRFILLTIRLSSIYSVEWEKGQASHMAGRDMNDWMVFLRYRYEDNRPRKGMIAKLSPDLDIYVVGPARRREDTEALGLAFIALLREAGVPLVSSSDDTRYVWGYES